MNILTRIGRLITVKNTKQKAFSNENESYKTVLVKTECGKVKCLMFTDVELSKAEARAAKNTEDQPKQGFWSKLLD
jgi:Fe2+ or Zn2+ uptake regulation protein